MKSVFVRSILKVVLVAGLMVWAVTGYASGCRDVHDYDICMNGSYYACSPVMQRCSLGCPNPPPPAPNCNTLCVEALTQCEAACEQAWCD